MRRPEQALQIAVVHFLRVALQPPAVYFAVPNGGYRTPREAALMKATGQLAGVADLCFLLPGGRAGFLELKAPKGRLSPEQIAFRESAQACGAYWAEARSLEQVTAILTDWGLRLKAQIAA